MNSSIKAMCKHGELLHRRKTAEAALKKAREMSRAGCYDIYITTPEGRDNHSSEFAREIRPWLTICPPHRLCMKAWIPVQNPGRRLKKFPTLSGAPPVASATRSRKAE